MDFNDVGARAADIRAHGVEEVGKVYDMGLLGGIFQDSDALGFHRGQHGVDGTANGVAVKVNMSAQQSAGGLAGPGVDHATVQVYLYIHGLKGLDVLVDGPDPEVAAAGHGHARPGAAAQQCTQKIIGPPHPAGQVIGDNREDGVGRVNFQGSPVQKLYLYAHIPQDMDQGTDVADSWYVLYNTRAIG